MRLSLGFCRSGVVGGLSPTVIILGIESGRLVIEVGMMLLILLIGFAIGLISSTPLGPINLTLIATALRGSLRESIAIAGAVALVDGCYAFAALSGISFADIPAAARRVLEVFGALLLIGYGLYLAGFVSTRPRTDAGRDALPSSYPTGGAAFFGGVVLYLSNPSFVALWLGVAAALSAAISEISRLSARLLFSLGVVVGTGVWFAGLIYGVRSKMGRVSPLVLRRMSLIASCSLTAFGGYALARGLGLIP